MDLLLTSYSAVVDAEGEAHRTALHQAAARGHVSTVNVLLRHAAQLRVKDIDGHTSLHLACMSGNFEIAKLFLEKREFGLLALLFFASLILR